MDRRRGSRWTIIGLVMLGYLACAGIVTETRSESEIYRSGKGYAQKMEKSFPMKKGGRLDLSTDGGGIGIQPWSKAEVHVKITERVNVHDREQAAEAFEDVEKAFDVSDNNGDMLIPP